VGKVLQALKDSGQEENTVIVFLSDHGDCHGAHRWNQKTVFFDESSRVPFIITWKGKTRKGTHDILVNVGVDLLPTLCDFAGIDAPAGLPGKSLKGVALGGTPGWTRDYVVSQNRMVQCEPVDGKDFKPDGRMIRSDRYKYCIYSEGRQRESLVDMKADPGEMVNQARNPAFREALLEHRRLLEDFAKQHKDDTALTMIQQVTRPAR
jgi:arylsulfatase A-like enzyme